MTYVRFLSATAVVLFGLCLVGCSGDGPVGEVSGKVTLNDTAVDGGMIIFASDDGKRVGSSPIAKDGTYTVKNAPVGKCKVTVSQTKKAATGGAADPGVGGTAGGDATVFVHADYGMADKSGFTHDVTKGKTTFDAKCTKAAPKG